MKKITIYGILFSLIFLFNATGCLREESDTCHRYIHFTNNSGKDVYHQIRIFNEVGEYNPALSPREFKIKNNKTEKLSNSTGFSCYELFAHEETGMIYLFLFDSEVAENYDWETVRNENLYLKKYVLTIDELNAMNWRITYSGD